MRNQYNFEPSFNDDRNMMLAGSDFPMNSMNISFPNMNMGGQGTNLGNFAEPSEAFTRGNLFNNLYSQYKNYRPMRLVANNEQAQMLLNLDIYCFAAHELRLYLDIFPNDREVIQLFNNYQSLANQALQEYERKYGPITWNALSGPNSFSWQETPWPWEMEGK